jgi:hypothetical protein
MDSSKSFCLANDLGTCESRFLGTKVPRNDNSVGVGGTTEVVPFPHTWPPWEDRGWGGLKLQGQNTHSNFAKGAKLEWGTRAGGAAREHKVPVRLRSGQALHCACCARFGRDDRVWEVERDEGGWLSIGRNYRNDAIVRERWEI